MALYRLLTDRVETIKDTKFADEKIKERSDLQRLLKDNIHVLSDDLMVIAEEYGEWEESNRRIDILAIDRDAKLVVLELKRTQDGGHMELQAIRYAAMVSTLTFDQVVRVHEQYLMKRDREDKARESILAFLDWDEPNDEQFADDVRIILVAADFSKEITSTVLWLNRRELDITCIRIKPYKLDEVIIIDAQQLIPLPEAEEYQVRIKEKDKIQRSRKGKSLQEILQEIETNCTAEEASSIQEIYDWLQSRVTTVFATANGFASNLVVRENPQWPFKVTTRGVIQIWFQYLANRPPFSDETLRLQLLGKLNGIPGVNISEDRISGKPSFPVKLLTSREEMQKFKDAFEWAFSMMEAEPKQEAPASL